MACSLWSQLASPRDVQEKQRARESVGSASELPGSLLAGSFGLLEWVRVGRCAWGSAVCPGVWWTVVCVRPVGVAPAEVVILSC